MAGSPHIPQTIGVIMDGNRRWAREHNLPTLEGHKRGYAKAKEMADWCRSAGVTHLILYAFSDENWNRPSDEVSYLPEMFNTLLSFEAEGVRKENGAIRFI